MAEIPNFASLEEMEAFLKGESPKKAKPTSPKKTGKGKKSKPVAGKKINSNGLDNGNEVRQGVWQALHFYIRPGESWQRIRMDAKEERENRGDSILIFAHAHNFGEACTTTCCEVLS